MAEMGGATVREMALAVPVTLMTWGEPEALSVRVTVSVRVPEAVGTKVMLMEHVPLGLITAALQVLGLLKSPGLAPPATTVEIVREPVPVLVTVTVIGPLLAPWEMAGKVTVLEESITLGVLGAE